MYYDSAPISFSLTMSSGNVRFFLANNYDQSFKKHCTGSILYYHVMKDAMSGGLTCFEFGTGGLYYKGRWGAEYMDDTRIYAIVPPGLRGKILRLALRVADKIRINLPV